MTTVDNKAIGSMTPAEHEDHAARLSRGLFHVNHPMVRKTLQIVADFHRRQAQRKRAAMAAVATETNAGPETVPAYQRSEDRRAGADRRKAGLVADWLAEVDRRQRARRFVDGGG